VTRREFLAAAGVLALSACGSSQEPVPPGNPRLVARPQSGVAKSLAAGTHRETASGTDFVAYVPQSALAKDAIPVMLFLHGALKTVEAFVEGHVPIANEHGVVVLAPYAIQNTWDAIYSSFGNDVRGIDNVLSWLFDRLPISPGAVGLSGFSDGATYTLGLGRANGDLFARIVGYSPGFLLPVTPVGKPPIAISHGIQDQVLPYATTRDQIVPALRNAGYTVDFRTFEGTHAVQLSLVNDSLQALASR
jgi:predicted esterase